MNIRQFVFVVCGSSLSVSAVLAGPEGMFGQNGNRWSGGPEWGNTRASGNSVGNSPLFSAYGAGDQRALGYHFGAGDYSSAAHSSAFHGVHQGHSLDHQFGDHGPTRPPKPAPPETTAPFLNPALVEASRFRTQGCEKPPACYVQPNLASSEWWHLPWVSRGAVVEKRTIVHKRVVAERRVAARVVKVADAVVNDPAPRIDPPRPARAHRTKVVAASHVAAAAQSETAFASSPEPRIVAKPAKVAPVRPVRQAAHVAPRQKLPATSEKLSPVASTALAGRSPVLDLNAQSRGQHIALDSFISERH